MKPGRNDPCPCGSGKKYKRCCLAADEAQANSPQERIWRRLRRQFDDGAHAAMMLGFVESTYGVEAIDEAWDEFTLWNDEPFDPGSPHVPVFMAWLFSQWSPDPAEDTSVADVRLHGVPPARALLKRKGYSIDPVLREYLESCLDRDRPMSVLAGSVGFFNLRCVRRRRTRCRRSDPVPLASTSCTKGTGFPLSRE